MNIVKFNARLLPVGLNLKRRRHADTDECMHCHNKESHQHLIRCPHQESQAVFENVLEETHEWLLQHTLQDIGDDLIYIVRYFRGFPRLDPPSAEYSTRVRRQIDLGQDAFFAGLWITQWQVAQEQFHKSIGSRRDSKKWICHIINKIQNIPLVMWNHRNAIRHRDTQQRGTIQQQEEMNRIIDDILDKKPHDRLMAHCDQLYFKKHSKEKIREMKIHRKNNWIAGAQLILKKYDRIETAQASRFTSYFQWDRG